MRRLIFSFIVVCSCNVQADTIDNYINISSNIPQMEMKADQQSQAWARSARNVLTITSESIAETLTQANDLAKNQGKPLFCLPGGASLDAAELDTIIQQTYKDISSQQSDKNRMTVSQVAWLGVIKKYPCQQQQNTISNLVQQVQQNTTTTPVMNPVQQSAINQMQHMGTILNAQK
ncbi:hypothetical protein BN59_00820 [Legionella massiliensis]|uniref:Phosphatase n=1 Tax=Legionella massiliensis TaxID=1034943 RepID=A0A078KU27_9GAMM|nr:phosphatase [Legionella massiliensis]CDZ76546.1 hypothetical protein BN59_00820 [Legionella massiliensis]CEE12284.1 hypothetical protein BN1094_00820 [Legionella massiliensis]